MPSITALVHGRPQPNYKPVNQTDVERQQHQQASTPPVHVKGEGPSGCSVLFCRILKAACVVILIAWIALAIAVAGIVVARHIRRNRTHRYCIAMDVPEEGELVQNVDVDVNNLVTRVETPKFEQLERGIFIHDFREKLTAILDVESMTCYVKPLNPDTQPPQDVSDLLQKTKDKYYENRIRQTQKTYKAVGPPLDFEEMASLDSTAIIDTCEEVDTYWLEEIDVKRRFKRHRSVELHEFGEIVPGQGLQNTRIMMVHKDRKPRRN